LAQQTGGRFSFRPSAEQLASLYATISNQVKKEYALTYTTPNSQCDGQKRDVEVTVSLAGGTTVAHGSYNPGGIMGGAQVPTSDKSAWKRNLIVLVAILISVLFLVFAPWWLEHFQKRRRATSLGPIPSPPDRADVVGRGSAEVEIKILREDAGPPAPAPSVDDIGIRLGDEDSPLAISSDLGPTETVSPREEASGDPSAPTPPSEESLSITLDDIEVESGRERTS